MAIPSFQEITLPLLQFAADGEIHRMIEAREHLAGVFALSEEDQEERLPSGTQGRFANRVAWAKVYLEKAGILQSPARGQFRITERGRSASTTLRHLFVEFSVQRLAWLAPFQAVGAC